MDNNSILELLDEVGLLIENLNSSNLRTFNSVIFVLDFFGEVVSGKSSEIVERYFWLLKCTLCTSEVLDDKEKSQEIRKFRKNMKKLNLDSKLIEIIHNYLYFKVAIKALDQLHTIDNIHQMLINFVSRKEKDIPYQMIDKKIDFLSTHVVKSLTSSSLTSKDYLVQYSSKNWRMIFALITEFKKLLLYHQANDTEGTNIHLSLNGLTKLEKALDDILKNCKYLNNVRETGIVSELIVCIH